MGVGLLARDKMVQLHGPPSNPLKFRLEGLLMTNLGRACHRWPPLTQAYGCINGWASIILLFEDYIAPGPPKKGGEGRNSTEILAAGRAEESGPLLGLDEQPLYYSAI